MQTHVRIAHFAFKFGFGNQSGDRVDNQNIDSAGANQRIGDFQSLFAGIRLRNQQVVNVNADFLGIGRVKSVFRIDESAGAAFFLRLCNNAQSQSGFAGTFRAVDFDNTAFGQPTDAQGDVYAQRTGGNGFNINVGVLTEAHNRTFAEGSFNLAQCRVKGFIFFHIVLSFCNGFLFLIPTISLIFRKDNLSVIVIP